MRKCNMLPFFKIALLFVLCTTVFASKIRGQAYSYDPHMDEWRPFSGGSVFTYSDKHDTYFGSIFEFDGEYTFYIPPGSYTLQTSASQGMIQLEREITVKYDETVVVSFKMIPAQLWSGMILTPTTRAYGYLITSIGSPIDGAILELPEYGVSDTTSSIGEFCLTPFDQETELQIHYSIGGEDTIHTISPGHCPQVIRIDSNHFVKTERIVRQMKQSSVNPYEAPHCHL